MSARYQQERPKILALRKQGLGYRSISRQTGVPYTTVRRIVNPEYAERLQRLSREAKRRRIGVCDICGGKTRYNGKGSGVSTTCAECSAQAQHNNRHWKRERVIAAIQEYVRRHGQPPISSDWLHQTAAERTEPDGFRYPHVAVVLRECGSWANAIEEAGFERPVIGWNPRGRKSGRDPWITNDEFLQRIVAYQREHGVAPSPNDVRSAYEMLRRRGFDWHQTLAELGMTPRPRGKHGTSLANQHRSE